MIENTGQTSSGRQRLPNNNIRLSDFRSTMLTPSIRFKTTKAPHKLGTAIVMPVHPYLLPVIAIAPNLDIGAHRETACLIDFCEQTNHTAS